MALTLICVGMIGVANAAGLNMTFSWETDGQTLSVVLSNPGSRGDVLFLPGGCDAKALTVTLQGEHEICWGGKTLHTGDMIDVSGDIGASVEVTRDGKKLGSVKVLQGSEIPAVFLRVTAADLKHIYNSKRNDIREAASVVILDGDGKVECADSLTSLHMRGNSTVFTPKKPFQFKLSEKADLFNMGKAKTWILLANWFDVSLLRNQITLDLCKELGLNGTPECRQTDVYINGSYNGTYLLTEKIQLKKSRLDITDMEEEMELQNDKPLDSYRFCKGAKSGISLLKWFDIPNEPEDITGGYLLEIEKPLHFSRNNENGGFKTDGEMFVVVKEPSQVGFESVSYIANLVNDFHNAVLAKNGVNRKTGRSYTDYIDSRSFALKIIVEELSANFDVRAASQFMYKDSSEVDDKLYAGPGWDYDLSFGNREDGQQNPLRLNFVYRRSSNTSHLYHYLLTHDDFKQLTRSLYDEELVPAVEILLGRRRASRDSYLYSIDEYIDMVADSAGMNFTRWTTSTITDLNKSSGLNFADATSYLKNWITQRFDIMTEQWLVAKP